MKRGQGNQYDSRKADLWAMICTAHDFLIAGEVEAARYYLGRWREAYAQAPASSRRRWKCGR